MKNVSGSPLTFDLQEDTLRKLKAVQSRVGARSASEVVRYAVSAFDPAQLKPGSSPHRQISVRLSPGDRRKLVALSRSRGVSVGEILRAALESLPANPPDFKTETTMATKKATKKKAPAKKAVKKAPAKKAVKKKVAKKPVKKTVKKVAKKAVKSVTKAAKKVKKAAEKTTKKTAAKKPVKKAAKKAAKKPAKKAAKKGKSKKK